MGKLQEIVITPTINHKCQITITLLKLELFGYDVIIKTNYKGIVTESKEFCVTYDKAFEKYINSVQKAAEFTTLINLQKFDEFI